MNRQQILIINEHLPLPRSGNGLRVIGTAKALASIADVHLAVPGGESAKALAFSATDVFASVTRLPAIQKSRNPIRHARLSDAHYYKRYHSQSYREIMRELDRIIEARGIDTVIAVTLTMAELLDGIHGVSRILDNYDSHTLMRERAIARARSSGSVLQLQNRIALLRSRRQESALARKYERVTTISPADLRRLRSLNKAGRERIVLIPNGVSDEALRVFDPSADDRFRLVFWGHLSFPPNREAIRWFYRHVYRRFLAGDGVEWHIIGGDAGPDLVEMARGEPSIWLHGFVENLYETAARHTVFVNPMVTGGGFKNKLVEAFAVGTAVVSTTLGVESVPEAVPEVHYLCADSGRAMATQILRLRRDATLRRNLAGNAHRLVEEHYSWTAVARQWQGLIRGSVLPAARFTGGAPVSFSIEP
jgi:glycosyltransferase involved in cell wall biosynthesis